MEDSLTEAELATFGVSSAEETLPMPPPKEGTNVGAGGSTGAKRSSDASSIIAPIGRAKRPKNVKFSPAKVGGKALARRSMTTTGGPKNGTTDGEISLPNNDFCDCCGGKGHFLCCDGGCLRSFHFTCLEPPMELDDLTDESWFCKACRAIESPPPKYDLRFFKELIYRVDTENPKAFGLTPDIKGLFRNVTTGATGDFIDIQEHRPPSKITGRAVGQEDRDGYRLKDKAGRTILCYKCNTSASVQKLKRIISCDFCEQHWHLDCLDPPMTGMPPPTRKWMCPVHSDHVLPKTRQLKQTQTVVVQQPGQHNNGDVIIIPRREAPRPMDEFEEITVNRIRYQVPEETLIIDFWGRLQDPAHLEQAKRARKRVTEAGSPIAIDSPQSDDDLSDADPPNTAVKNSKPISPPSTLALDNLASLAELFFSQLNTEPNLIITNLAPSPSATTSYSTQDKGKGRATNEPTSPTNTRNPTFANTMRRSTAAGSGPVRGSATEFSVQTKEDLKALSRVRQLLGQSGSDALDTPTRNAYLDFLDGEAIIPKLASMTDADSSKSPWDLPWESDSVSSTTSASATTAAVSTTARLPLPPQSVAAAPNVVRPRPSDPTQLQHSPVPSNPTHLPTNGDRPVPKFTPRPSYVAEHSPIPGLASSTFNPSSTSPTIYSNDTSARRMSGLNTSTSNPNRPTIPLPARPTPKAVQSPYAVPYNNNNISNNRPYNNGHPTSHPSLPSRPIGASTSPILNSGSIPGLNNIIPGLPPYPSIIASSTAIHATSRSNPPITVSGALEVAALKEQAKKEMSSRGLGRK